MARGGRRDLRGARWAASPLLSVPPRLASPASPSARAGHTWGAEEEEEEEAGGMRGAGGEEEGGERARARWRVRGDASPCLAEPRRPRGARRALGGRAGGAARAGTRQLSVLGRLAPRLAPPRRATAAGHFFPTPQSAWSRPDPRPSWRWGAHTRGGRARADPQHLERWRLTGRRCARLLPYLWGYLAGDQAPWERTSHPCAPGDPLH